MHSSLLQSVHAGGAGLVCLDHAPDDEVFRRPQDVGHDQFDRFSLARFSASKRRTITQLTGVSALAATLKPAAHGQPLHDWQRTADAIRDIAAAQRLPVSRLVRDAVLGRQFPPPPPAIPAVNRAVYSDLAGIGNNLNQIARHLNGGGSPDAAALHINLVALATALKSIRADLLTGGRS